MKGLKICIYSNEGPPPTCESGVIRGFSGAVRTRTCPYMPVHLPSIFSSIIPLGASRPQFDVVNFDCGHIINHQRYLTNTIDQNMDMKSTRVVSLSVFLKWHSGEKVSTDFSPILPHTLSFLVVFNISWVSHMHLLMVCSSLSICSSYMLIVGSSQRQSSSPCDD